MTIASLLVDPRLVERAIVIDGELAVPIGGVRRGGFVLVRHARAAAARRKLRGRRGFPRARLEPGGELLVLAWGAAGPPVPDDGASLAAWKRYDIAAGRHHGYRDDAIAEYLIDAYRISARAARAALSRA